MKKILLSLSVALLALACDDGDIDTPSFQFGIEAGTTVEECTGNSNKLLFYQISTGNTEALSLNLNATNDENDSFYSSRYTSINNSTIDVNYRIFNAELSNGSSYFCQNLPPTSPSVVQNWTGEATIVFTPTITVDDGDGISNEDEDINGNGDFEDDDTDGDGIPNYKDEDDDGDGIDTKTEIAHYIEANGDDGIYNSDDDDKPNYLDTDDDNDGVDTNLENTEDTDGANGRHYLDGNTSTVEEKRVQGTNTYNTTYALRITLNNLNLSNNNTEIRYDTFEYGNAPEKTIPTSQSFDNEGNLIVE